MAYDGVHGVTVLFGGLDVFSTAAPLKQLDDTWTWDGERWVQMHPPVSPPGRSVATMVYDPAHQVSVLFGGDGLALTLNDTWSWDGTTWARLYPVHSPPPTRWGLAAYDPRLREVVLVRQVPEPGGNLDETWTWDGTDWTHLSTTRSPRIGRYAAWGMAYHPSSGGMILLAHQDDGSPATWMFDGKTWTLLLTASPEGPSHYPGSMALDGATGDVIALDFFGPTWRWDGFAWVQLPVVRFPPARRLEVMTYDSTRQEIVMFGGLSGDGQTHYGDTWTWDGQTWTQHG